MNTHHVQLTKIPGVDAVRAAIYPPDSDKPWLEGQALGRTAQDAARKLAERLHIEDLPKLPVVFPDGSIRGTMANLVR